MAVGSIASHQQYLVSMHVLLITAAGCPLHGPELFIHTNGHKYATTHTHAHTHRHTHTQAYTQNTASEKNLAFCFLCLQCFLSLSVSLPPSLSFFPSLLSFTGSLQLREIEQTSPSSLFLSLLFLTSRSPRCLLMDSCLIQHILIPVCCVFVSNNIT